MFNFSLHFSFRFFALGFLGYDVDCIFFQNDWWILFFVLLGTISWFLNFRILKFSIFWNFFEFGWFSLVAVLFFRISNNFFDFFLWCLRGLLLFYLFFIKIYKKTRFSLNKILLQLTGRLFGCCDEFDHQGHPRAQNQN